MPKVDFYILPETTMTARLQFICRLIEKAYKNQHRIYIHTDNEADAHKLDEMLWTYREDSFLPHNLYGEGPEPAPPIQIGFNTTPEKHRDILINLSATAPKFLAQFKRLLEIIPNNEGLQAQGRERFKLYRAQQLEITTHKLESTQI
jgi:DNA polymerase-3 subunit chi